MIGVPLLNGFLHAFILSYTKERGNAHSSPTYSLWSLKWESPARNRMKVVAKQAADFDRAKGLSVMENILQSHKDIQAVFAHNDEMALGALEAHGMNNVLVPSTVSINHRRS
ncbi:Ribose ABC transport system periplasmic ribose-binding protein RbsB [Geobacillus stearothermophilus]|uniref:Ribose ABC transport system periplasmic ribose-binding protein RbsB n=2 Tax=Geobacillus stearothermophilus TaxID=1422 RepID=A0ABQ7HJW3_GEOSE|nr:Ribose ABC transport system periplasmic ribose-binding protein RbsB [Geobacillus stearothermophilus]